MELAPCGAIDSTETGLEYFLEVERQRYEEYAPWMPEALGFDQWSGKRVLELGFGQGTDLVQHARAGAECFGVDITQRHYELANTNLQVRGLEAALFLEDASKLPFPDGSFDRVYTFGVLHHTPDTDACIAEAYRVLRPGGELLLAMYHRWSAFYLFSKLLFQGVLRGDLRRLGHDGLLATIEEGADGITVKPLVKLYSRRQLRRTVKAFAHVEIEVHHLDRAHFGRLGRLVPAAAIPWLEPLLGWYVIAKAIK